MGRLELCGLLDCRFVQHCMLNVPNTRTKFLPFPEHLDDIVLYDCQRALLVAVMALRVDRLHYFRHFHLHDWTNWRYVPYQLSSR